MKVTLGYGPSPPPPHLLPPSIPGRIFYPSSYSCLKEKYIPEVGGDNIFLLSAGLIKDKTELRVWLLKMAKRAVGWRMSWILIQTSAVQTVMKILMCLRNDLKVWILKGQRSKRLSLDGRLYAIKSGKPMIALNCSENLIWHLRSLHIKVGTVYYDTCWGFCINKYFFVLRAEFLVKRFRNLIFKHRYFLHTCNHFLFIWNKSSLCNCSKLNIMQLLYCHLESYMKV